MKKKPVQTFPEWQAQQGGRKKRGSIFKNWRLWAIIAVLGITITLAMASVIPKTSQNTPTATLTASATATVIPPTSTALVPPAECDNKDPQGMMTFLSPSNLSLMASEVKQVLWIEGNPTKLESWNLICPKSYIAGPGVVFVDSRDGLTKLMPAPKDVNTNVLLKETIIFPTADGTPVPTEWQWYLLK